MGLDMYLNRMPRYKSATASDVDAVEDFLDWVEAKAKGSEYAKGTFKDWCGREKVPSSEYLEFYTQFYNVRYYHWDIEHKYGHNRIMEQVGYWRKANEIHNWFVENVQDGEDDCDYHREVTKEDLEELLDICNKVLASCKLVDGKIENGYNFDENGNRIPILVDGKYVEDPSVAEELLPTTSGFFFGGTSYDEYYVEDIESTIDIITQALETTDFETEMIYYVSSW